MFLLYRILLSLHIIAVIAWMAGILYLLRLHVYHSKETESVVKDRFKVMEFRLYRYITLPSMIAALTFGTAMILINPALTAQGWLQAKLVFVAVLVGITYYSGQLNRIFSKDKNIHTDRYYRILNEIPTILMIIIVFLVILKPF